MKVQVTADQLFSFANEYARQNERDGHGSSYPTLAEVSKHFNCSMRKVEEVANEHTTLGYLGLIVARGRPGFGWGTIGRKADWLIEAYE